MRPQIQALGNLTKTPQLEHTKNGVPTCTFTVACNGGRDDDAVFIWCRAYRTTAENVCKYLEKGSPIFVVGELSQYVSEKDKLSHTYCDVLRVQFVGGGARREPPPPADERRAGNAAQQSPAEKSQEDSEGEPF